MHPEEEQGVWLQCGDKRLAVVGGGQEVADLQLQLIKNKICGIKIILISRKLFPFLYIFLYFLPLFFRIFLTQKYVLFTNNYKTIFFQIFLLYILLVKIRHGPGERDGPVGVRRATPFVGGCRSRGPGQAPQVVRPDSRRPAAPAATPACSSSWHRLSLSLPRRAVGRRQVPKRLERPFETIP